MTAVTCVGLVVKPAIAGTALVIANGHDQEFRAGFAVARRPLAR